MPLLHALPVARLQCTILKTIDGDKDVWAYDKRFHTSLEESLRVPPIEMPPAYQPGWKTIEGAAAKALCGPAAAVETVLPAVMPMSAAQCSFA
jgi:hypothetical protein